MEKTEFSCLRNKEFLKKLKNLKVDTIVIFGIEAHVCVLQTALDAVENGYEVHVVADAVSSRTEENRSIGLERMRQAGAFIDSTEIVLFQLLEKAGTPEFREISMLIR
jgi:nicotinamidase-related amidase